MGGGRTQSATPLAVFVRRSATIHDEALPAGAHFNRKTSSMRMGGKDLWRWRADIQQHEGTPTGKPLIGGMRRMSEGAPLDIVAFQKRRDQLLIAFTPAIEHRKPAVAEAEKPHHWGHAIKGTPQGRLGFAVRCIERLLNQIEDMKGFDQGLR